MMTRGGEGGKKCRKFDDVICERPLTKNELLGLGLKLRPFKSGRKSVCDLKFKLSKFHRQ